MDCGMHTSSRKVSRLSFSVASPPLILVLGETSPRVDLQTQTSRLDQEMYRECAACGLGKPSPARHWNSTLEPFYCHGRLLTQVRRKPDSPIGGIRFAVHHYTICLKKANQVATVEGDACEFQVVFDERCEVGNGSCSCLCRARHALEPNVAGQPDPSAQWPTGPRLPA
jgi:hypothetical protein